MHKVNAGYTLLVRLESDGEAPTAALLADYDAHPEHLPFDQCTTVHFASITILPVQAYSDEIDLPATLMFATSYAGPTRTHVQELVRVLGPQLRALFRYCEGFPSEVSDKELERFIREHRHGDTFYSGMQHLSPEDVRNHKQLREEIQAYLDREQANGGITGEAPEVRKQIQDYVKGQPHLAWAQQPATPPPGSLPALYWRTLLVAAFAVPAVLALLVGSLALPFCHSAKLGAAVAAGWLGVILLLLFVVGILSMVRDAEKAQTYVARRMPDDFVRELAATQNRLAINEFTVVGPIKEGTFRPVFLRIMLWIVARVVEGIPLVKKLQNGNIPTVATARWIACDEGRRLIFISNYTNAAEPYVRDFIDVPAGARNINITFGFGRGYPITRWVLEDGAVTDPNGFIYVVTANQRRTHFWYGPYRDMTIDNIKHNRKIREGLFADLDEAAAQTWLHLL